jgi:glycosyltransferase involved in cell wall biosynthesis
MVDNWNTIVAIATGKYFLLLSDDDLLHPTAIEQMVLRYETADRASTSIGFVYCSTRFIDKTGKTLSTTKSVPAIQTAKELILGVFGYTRKVMLCSILFRTADVVPGFPSGFQLANDSALWMPLVIRYGSAAFVDELLVSYRIASNLSLSVTSDVWMADNRNLLHLVFAEFKAHGQDTPELTAKLHRALKRHTIHTIANGIKVSNPGDKLGELRGYLNNYRSFLSPYGAKVLLQRVGALLLPEQIKASLRRSIRS